MKKLVVFLIMALVSMPVLAVPIWSVDFENGFTASSGTAHVVQGDLANPADPTKEVRVKTDPVNALNNALDVQYIITSPTTARSSLAYDNLPSGIDVGGKNTVSVDYYLANADTDSLHNLSFMPWTINNGQYGVQTDFGSRVQLFLKRASGVWSGILWGYKDYVGGGGYYVKKEFAVMPLGIGWHNFVTSWDVTGTDPTTGRPIANLSVIADGETLYSATNGAWVDFTENMISVGCKYDGYYGSYQTDALELGNLVDNVVITPEPATMAILLGGVFFLRWKKIR